MIKRFWRLAGMIGLLLTSLPATAAAEDVAQSLQRQTREMIDAITAGTPAVWERYLDAKAVYTAEDGTISTKAQMVAQIGPLPEGVTGTIKVIDFKATVHGSVAITSYVSDEQENYHGHALHCQYRTTDTWLKTPAGWRLIAGQVLALRTDPPAIQLPVAKLEEYSGRYSLTPTITYEIRRTADGLEGQQAGRATEAVRAEAPDVLFVPGKPRYRKIFQRDSEGRVTGFLERREAWDLQWTRMP